MNRALLNREKLDRNSMSELRATIWKLELKVTRITRVRSYKIKND